MADKLIHEYLRKNNILGLSQREQLPAIVKLVANIPWGEGRTIDEVLVTKKVGTCTGKHLVLQACFDELGIKYKPVVCTFHWGDQPIKYPQNLKNVLNEGEWEHGHNFVQIIVHGKAIDVDITWNQKLKPYGFKTFPLGWNGTTSFIGVNNIIRRWDGTSIADMKKGLIGSLDDEMRERRERFLKGFIQWVDLINNEP